MTATKKTAKVPHAECRAESQKGNGNDDPGIGALERCFSLDLNLARRHSRLATHY
jgi:hypothetical protein